MCFFWKNVFLSLINMHNSFVFDCNQSELCKILSFSNQDFQSNATVAAQSFQELYVNRVLVSRHIRLIETASCGGKLYRVSAAFCSC